MEMVQTAYQRSRRTYGYRRIKIWIEREFGVKINHKTVLRLMRKLNIQSIARKRNPYRDNQNLYGAIHFYPNHLQQNFLAKKPNQKWGTDITYIRTDQGYVYLAIIKDFFDGTILGYSISKTPTVRIILKALQKAVAISKPKDGLILHSDAGVQFRSNAYKYWVDTFGIKPSMSRKATPLDNAPTESFFSHLKSEYINHEKIVDFNEAQLLVDDYIDFYNHDRIQLKTKLAPMEYRRQHL